MWGFFSICLMGSFHTLSLQKAYSFYWFFTESSGEESRNSNDGQAIVEKGRAKKVILRGFVSFLSRYYFSQRLIALSTFHYFP